MKLPLALFLSMLLLVGSFFPQTDVEEVYKIPWLFTHYQEHKAQTTGNFGFSEFLALHYSPGSAHAKTPHKGVSIPLYNHLSLGMVFILILPVLDKFIKKVRLLDSYPSAYHNTYTYLFSLSLLQPPRV